MKDEVGKWRRCEASEGKKNNDEREYVKVTGSKRLLLLRHMLLLGVLVLAKMVGGHVLFPVFQNVK